jgi:tetratricopeptide (TPR) repeat protein
MFDEWIALNEQKKELYSQGKINEAIVVANQLLTITRNLFLDPSNNIANALNDLALLYAIQGQWIEAEFFYVKAIDMYRQLLDDTVKTHQDLATSLSNLAVLYTTQEKWTEAEDLHLKSVSIFRQLFGQTANNYLATSLNNLAHLYGQQGRWDESVSVSLEVIRIRRQLLDEAWSKDVANNLAATLSNLAGLYTFQGKWMEAESLSLEAIHIFHKLFGSTATNNDLARILNNFAKLCEHQGKWMEAESSYIKSINIRRQLLDEISQHELATTLSNLAQLYAFQEKLTEAELLCAEALNIFRQLFGDTPNHGIALTLHHAGVLYIKQGRFKEAESFFMTALDILRSLFDKAPNRDIANCLGSLANSYTEKARLEKAEPLYAEALDINRQLFGETPNMDTAICLGNLATLYTEQERLEEAELIHLESLDINRQLFGDRGHPNLVTSHRSYAFSLVKQERLSEAMKHFALAARVDIKVLADRFQGQTEAERLSYRDRRQDTINLLLSCLWEYLADDTDAIIEAFEVIYLWKSITTAVEITLSAAISRSDDLELQQLATERQQLRRQLTQITQKPPTENIEDYQQEVERLQTQLNKLEKEIVAKVPRAELMETEIDRQVINQLVPAGAVLVDFVRFNLCNLVNFNEGETHYLAFVLTDEGLGGIKLVKLGTATEVDELIAIFRQVASDLNDPKTKVKKMNPFEEDEPARDPNVLLAPYQTYAINLRQAILDPLDLPAHSTKVIFAPDGDLNLVPFSILPLENGILSDQLSIRYVSASRDLRPRSQSPIPASVGTITANPNYDFPTQAITPPPTTEIQKSGSISTLSQKLTPLPQTEPLAQKIAQSLGIKPHLGNDAQAINLRQLRSPKYLVIATHGLHGLDPEGGDNPDPMRDAGLALAGFNTSRAGGELPSELEGGLFTARDLLELDLWGTQIAILLACSSGTGAVRQGEGIFGLKRALAIAGVATLIVSLWDVPVQASILLMDKFFEYYQGGAGQPAAIALQQAQSYIRSISRAELLLIEQGRIILQEIDAKIDHLQGAEHPLQHPMFWGAWLCQG